MSTRNGTSGSGHSRVSELKVMWNCAGIDWASEKHDVLIEDPAGEELLAGTFAHDEDGIRSLCGALACFEVEIVAIERPDGVLVERLLESAVRLGVAPESAEGGTGPVTRVGIAQRHAIHRTATWCIGMT
jgi:hypothetical protein